MAEREDLLLVRLLKGCKSVILTTVMMNLMAIWAVILTREMMVCEKEWRKKQRL